MEKEIVIIQKTKVSSFPPLMAFMEYCKKTGVSIILICGNEFPSFMPFLEENCSSVIMLNVDDAKPGILNKLYTWLKFNIKVWSAIRKNKLKNCTFYIPTADTILAMGPRTKRLRYILNLYELYDEAPVYLKHLRQYVAPACLITCPDDTRAHIFRVWWNLKKTPLVIPNRPLSRPETDMEAPAFLSSFLEKIGSKKIIHYQGLITPDRGLEPIVQAVSKMSNYVLVLMGRKSEYLDKLLTMSDNIYHLPFVAPPQHLAVTKRASIGVLSYDHSCLNNIFCAPNKIWEYSSLGVPMLGNDIPGLTKVIQSNRLGECADYDDVASIDKAIRKIENNLEEYSRNSYQYFDNVCMSELYDKVIDAI